MDAKVRGTLRRAALFLLSASLAVCTSGARTESKDLAPAAPLAPLTPTIVQTEYADKLLTAETIVGLDENPAMSAKGYATVAYTYTEDGQVLTEDYYDLEGKRATMYLGYAYTRRTYTPVNGYAKAKLLTEERYLADGSPACPDGGFFRMENTYTDGLITATRYLDADGELIRPSGGYALIEYTYAEDGSLARKEYFGAGGHGDYVTGPEGGAIVEYEYEVSGGTQYLLSMAVYNAKHEPVLGVKSFHRQQNKYDSRYNLVRTSYYDAEGNPTRMIEGYASVSRAYDTKNRLIETCYYNADGDLTKMVTGFARVTYTYDGANRLHFETYYGADNQRTMLTNGYSMAEHEYNGPDYDYRITYFDIEDEYTMIKDGFSRIEWLVATGVGGADRGISLQKRLQSMVGSILGEDSGGYVRRCRTFDQHMELVELKAGFAGYENAQRPGASH